MTPATYDHRLAVALFLIEEGQEREAEVAEVPELLERGLITANPETYGRTHILTDHGRATLREWTK